MIKQEIRTFSSQNPDGSLKYPGRWLLAWAQCGAMPWVLIGIEACP
jgi:hypothetical protein